MHCSAPLLLLLTITSLISFSHSISPQYTACAPLLNPCGTQTNISYPFTTDNRPNYCGSTGYYLRCSDNNLTISISNKPFQIANIDYVNHLLNIVDMNFVGQLNCPQFTNTSIDASLFQLSDRNHNLTVYINCNTPASPVQAYFEAGCIAGFTSGKSYYRLTNGTAMDDLVGACASTVTVPLRQDEAELLAAGNITLWQALQQGFYVNWLAGMGWCDGCAASGGHCGSSNSNISVATGDDHTCFCPNGTNGSCGSTDQGDDSSHTKRVITGVVCGLGGFLIACAFCYYCYKRKTRKNSFLPSSTFLVENVSSKSFSKKDPESISFHCQTHLFSYEELVEATNNFDSSKELGDGGYGTVYKGLLRDGRVVAVKRLYETSYKRIEQFMNEVEILSRLRHPNLVTLYGSTSPNSPHLLLVYEFIPNGTIADHLHDPLRSRSVSLALRLSMAIDTASALSYLHSVDIIHRDVKSHNILVDQNFNVKVADFGLSRLFPPNATHVSTAPQGTPGYLDPEYHRFYQLTDKSDVYSFGVVLMELLASRPAVDIDRKPNEISLAMAAINKIQKGELDQLVDPLLRYQSDKEANRIITQMAELAFRCLQMDREMRPSIKEVLEALKEIEKDCCSDNKGYEIKVKEDAGLLRNSVRYSPDTVIAKWGSRSTTPNSSDPNMV